MSDTKLGRKQSSEENATTVSVNSLSKQFGNTTAVNSVDFEIKEGEFFSLLGPSGCGKTTTLRMIAGFESPTSGEIQLHGEDIIGIPPYERDAGMVFQGYALFPHKTVGENVGFGLKMDGVPSDERSERVAEALDLVNLPGIEDRSPGELSGGQQQRVALARALVIEPSVLLLDEPLSSLDYMLRKEMRFELKRIQEELGITTIYVTHDQQEALAMSDRILVMNDGEAQQIGTPYEIYNEPSSEFVADFIGESNLFDSRVTSLTDGQVELELTEMNQTVVLPSQVVLDSVTENDEVLLSLRPEDLQVATADTSTQNTLVGSVQARTFLGSTTRYLLDVDGKEVLVELSGQAGHRHHQTGDDIEITWEPTNCIVITKR